MKRAQGGNALMKALAGCHANDEEDSPEKKAGEKHVVKLRHSSFFLKKMPSCKLTMNHILKTGQRS